MRITLKHNGHNIYLLFPTRILCSKTAIRILNHFNHKHGKCSFPYIPSIYAKQLYREIKKSKRRYGRTWSPIELESAKGDAIKIKF